MRSGSLSLLRRLRTWMEAIRRAIGAIVHNAGMASVVMARSAARPDPVVIDRAARAPRSRSAGAETESHERRRRSDETRIAGCASRPLPPAPSPPWGSALRVIQWVGVSTLVAKVTRSLRYQRDRSRTGGESRASHGLSWSWAVWPNRVANPQCRDRVIAFCMKRRYRADERVDPSDSRLEKSGCALRDAGRLVAAC